jgi:DNA replication protein DnaC
MVAVAEVLACGDGRYASMLKSLARMRVLILDDWGLATLAADQRRDLLEIVGDRNERASSVVTGQLPVAHWSSSHSIRPRPALRNARTLDVQVARCVPGRSASPVTSGKRAPD